MTFLSSHPQWMQRCSDIQYKQDLFYWGFDLWPKHSDKQSGCWLWILVRLVCIKIFTLMVQSPKISSCHLSGLICALFTMQSTCLVCCLVPTSLDGPPTTLAGSMRSWCPSLQCLSQDSLGNKKWPSISIFYDWFYAEHFVGEHGAVLAMECWDSSRAWVALVASWSALCWRWNM